MEIASLRLTLIDALSTGRSGLERVLLPANDFEDLFNVRHHSCTTNSAILALAELIRDGLVFTSWEFSRGRNVLFVCLSDQGYQEWRGAYLLDSSRLVVLETTSLTGDDFSMIVLCQSLDWLSAFRSRVLMEIDSGIVAVSDASSDPGRELTECLRPGPCFIFSIVGSADWLESPDYFQVCNIRDAFSKGWRKP